MPNKTFLFNIFFTFINENFVLTGLESVLLVSSLHSYFVVHTNVLEVCSDYCFNFCYFCYCKRLGNQKGKQFTYLFIYFVYLVYLFINLLFICLFSKAETWETRWSRNQQFRSFAMEQVSFSSGPPET